MSVRIDIVQQATGQAAAELRETSAAAKALKAELDAASQAGAKGTKELTAAQRLEATQVGQSAKGFQDLTGKITGFLGAATFAAGAVAGIVAAIVELIPNVKSLDEIISESEESLRQQSVQLAAVTEATRKAADAYLDLAAARDGELAADVAAERAARTEKDLEAALKGRLAVLKEIAETEQQTAWMEEGWVAMVRAQIAADEDRLKKLEGVVGREMRVLEIRHRLGRNTEILDRFDALRLDRVGKIADLEAEIAQLMGDQARAAEVLAFVGPRLEDAGPQSPKPPKAPKAGAGRRAAAAADADAAKRAQSEADAIRQLELAMASTVDQLTAAETRYEQEVRQLSEARISEREWEARTATALLRLVQAQDAAASQAQRDREALRRADAQQAAEEERTLVQRAQAELQMLQAEVATVTEVFEAGLSPMEHWGKALSGIATQAAMASRQLISTQSAVAAGSAMVVGAIAEEMESESARMALLAIRELGLGWAATARFDPVSAKAHFIAAGILGVGAGVAALSGGGGGQERRQEERRDQRGVRPREGGGNATIVVSPAAVVDGPGLTRMVAEAERRAWRSGLHEQGAW